MKWMSRRKWVRVLSGVIIASFLALTASAKSRKDHPHKYSVVDMPVSLAVGTVRTPEFSVVPLWYDIIVEVEKPLPFRQMECMVEGPSGLLETKDCGSNDPLLQADWTVWEGDRIVDKGTMPKNCVCSFEDKHIYRSLGSFGGEAGKKYVVEVKFTKDGTPLNIANPHLIVILHKDFW